MDFPFCSVDPFVCPFANPHCLEYYSFAVRQVSQSKAAFPDIYVLTLSFIFSPLKDSRYREMYLYYKKNNTSSMMKNGISVRPWEVVRTRAIWRANTPRRGMAPPTQPTVLLQEASSVI